MIWCLSIKFQPDLGRHRICWAETLDFLLVSLKVPTQGAFQTYICGDTKTEPIPHSKYRGTPRNGQNNDPRYHRNQEITKSASAKQTKTQKTTGIFGAAVSLQFRLAQKLPPVAGGASVSPTGEGDRDSGCGLGQRLAGSLDFGRRAVFQRARNSPTSREKKNKNIEKRRTKTTQQEEEEKQKQKTCPWPTGRERNKIRPRVLLCQR